MRYANQLTLTEKACRSIPGYAILNERFERSIVINGRSESTLRNYQRCLAHLALHHKKTPTELNQLEIENYLLHLKRNCGTPSEAFFKHTVYGLRYLYRVEGRETTVKLPVLRAEKKLPVVLSRSEIRKLLMAPRTLKERVLIGLLYGCGLRNQEVRALRVSDIDLDRNMIHIRQSKGKKDRYVPIGQHLRRGLLNYLTLYSPSESLFVPSYNRLVFSPKVVSSVLHRAVKKTDIKKRVTAHTLRHTYATHLLEDGLDIISIKELLGHANVQTTMVYLHVTHLARQAPFSPLDRLYSLS